jgi:hypothetical protein
MQYTGLLKRVIPFVLTFAAGLLLASLFVSITPNFRGWQTDYRGGRKCHEKRKLAIENQDLRERLRATELEVRGLRQSFPDNDAEFVIPNAVPPVEFDAYHPPKPPRKPKGPDSPR